MEINFLPQTQKNRKSTGKLLTGLQTTGLLEELRFLYAGSNMNSFELLVNAFNFGFAANNLKKATSILHRLEKNNSPFPDVIIIEGSFPVNDIKTFYNRFALQLKHQTIILLDSTSVNQKEIEFLKPLQFVDDIINLKTASAKIIQSKVNFWKKVNSSVAVKTEQSAREIIPSIPFWKRMIDILVSITLLVFLSPVFLLIMLLLKLESGGSVFYISKRAGRGYKIFNFYKFRTMENDAENKINEFMYLNQYRVQEGPLFLKFKNDPRITKIGAFLRKTSLDELPQLLNVLKGDMSIVGNRPLPLYEAETLTSVSWADRFVAPAGITGLWQVTRKGKFDMSAEDRIQLDINYAQNHCLKSDLRILLNTPLSVIQQTNS